MLGIRSVVLVGVLGLGVAGGSAITSLAYGNSSAIAMDEDHHPEIHHAMHALHEARDALVSAAHDYHGHRQAAVDHVDAALHECQVCIDEGW